MDETLKETTGKTEVIFQQVTHGGMPVVVEGLEVLKAVLEEAMIP